MNAKDHSPRRYAMMKKTGKGSAWVTGLLVLAALALALWPAEGRTACTKTAAELCASLTSDTGTDCDEDGFSDYLECAGFTVGSKQYSNPTGKDLFLAVAQTNPSNITDADLANVAATLGNQLGVAVHLISYTDFVPNSIRQVTSGSDQKGLVIAENSFTSTGVDRTTLGYTYPLARTPNDSSLSATVYTGRLEAYVDFTVCPVATYPKCVDSNGVGRQDPNDADGLDELHALYHRQNILHELSHTLSLAPVTGSHYSVNTRSPFNNSIMSQYVYTKAYSAVRKTGEPAKQVFYIPFTYSPSDTAFKLK